MRGRSRRTARSARDTLDATKMLVDVTCVVTVEPVPKSWPFASLAATTPSQHADRAADHRDDHRLDQELQQDRRALRAPIALRMPISRVRSVTDTSMMFMMPMPPTSSEMPAIAPSRIVSVRAHLVRGARAGRPASSTVKSCGRRCAAVTQQVRDRLLRLVAACRRRVTFTVICCTFVLAVACCGRTARAPGTWSAAR